MTEKEPIEAHDSAFGDGYRMAPGDYYYNELLRREADRQRGAADRREAEMLKMTREMRTLTRLAALFAAVSVVVAVVK